MSSPKMLRSSPERENDMRQRDQEKDERRVLRPILAWVFGGCLIASALAACSSSPSSRVFSPAEDFAGAPEGTQIPVNTQPGDDYAVWMGDGSTIGIVLYGSSSCPRKATKMTVPDGFLESIVTLEKTGSKPCTVDSVPHTTVFDAPPFFLQDNSDIMIGLPSGKVVLSHGGGN